MDEKRKSIPRRMAEALPFVLFFSGLFFFEAQVFGIADALLGIVFLFFAHTMVHEPGLSVRNYAVRVAWFLVMALCASLAGLHPVAMVVGTGVYLFLVTIINSDDYLPRNHFWLGLGYLMLLVYPVTLDEIAPRMCATLLAIAATTAFVFVARYLLSKTGELDVFARDRSWMREALDEVGRQLVSLAEGRLDSIDPRRLFDLTQQYASMEYGTVFRQNGLLSGRQAYTFALLLCVEQVAYNIRAASNNFDKFDEQEKSYYRDLSELFFAFGQGRIRSVSQFASELNAFLESHHLDVVDHDESWRAILETLLRTVEDTRLSHDNTTPLLKSLGYRLYYLRDNVNLRNTQTRFALQLSLIVSVAMTVDVLLTAYADVVFGIWIPMVAFTLVNTYSDETLRSTVRNIAGTILGLGIFVILVNVLPPEVRMPVAVVLGYVVILAKAGPFVSVAAATQMALGALFPYATLGTTLFTRLSLVVIGALCVVSFMFFLLNTRRSATVRTKLTEMERIDVHLMKVVQKGLRRGYVNLWRTVQLLYYMHLNAGLLSRLSHSMEKGQKGLLGKRKQKPADQQLAVDVNRVLDLNYRFTMDAAHAVVLLDPRRAREDLWRTGAVYPDTTGRLEHLDFTAEKLDEELHDLEGMRHLEEGE